jgi:outer membrane protein assembly factor BamB
MNAVRVPLALMATLTAFTSADAEDWPQFRGPNGSGVATSKNLPIEFSHTEKVRWSVPIGDGLSSPIVVAGKVYTTSMTPAKKLTVQCHDAATGKEIWKQEFATGALPRITPPNSHASSTPACDGQRVYVYFSTIGLLALDAKDGHEVWRHPLPRPAYLMDWGAGNSPIVWHDTVFFCLDDDLMPYVIAVDAATGKQRWKTMRPDMLAGYAIPVMCAANGRTDLVIAGTGKMQGYDPGTGKLIWTCNTLLRTIMTSPVVKDDVIYIGVQSYGDSARTLKFALMEWLDTNQDGKLAKNEVPKEFWEQFDRSDKNQDGLLSGEEIDSAFQHPSNMAGGGRIVQAIRGGGTGDVTKTHLVWSTTTKAASNLSSVLVCGHRLYVVKAGGLASCFDTSSGKALWELQRLDNFGDYYASPVAADGKIYMAGRNGFVVVLEDGPEMRVLASNDMNGEILATPAIADGRIYIRTKEKLFCVAQ